MAGYHEELAKRIKSDTKGTRTPLIKAGSAQDASGFDSRYPGSARDWDAKAKSWADGTKRSLFRPSSEEKAVRGAVKALRQTMSKGQPEQQEKDTSMALENLLSEPPIKTSPLASQARLQHSIMVVEALSVVTTSENAGNALLAVEKLPPEARRQLMMADQLTGNRLYNEFHNAARLHDLGQAFEGIRADAQVAGAMNRMNQRDLTGTEARLTDQFMSHLRECGVSAEAQTAFADKLAFKSQVSVGQKRGADIASMKDIRTLNAFPGDVEGRFTGQLYAALAETPGVSDEELAKALDLPQEDLVRVTANSAMRNREGDARILTLVSESVSAEVSNQVGEHAKLQSLRDVLHNVSAGRYDRQEFAKLVSEGQKVEEVHRTLKQTADITAFERSTKASVMMQETLQKMADRRDFLRNEYPSREKFNNPGEEEKAKALSAELDAFLQRFPKDQFTQEKMLPVYQHFGDNITDAGNPFFGAQKDPENENVTVVPFRKFMSFTEQLDGHQKALENPAHYGEGLDQVMPVLPTAGRELQNCLWLASTVEDMARTAELVRTEVNDYSLEKAPIIVIDQSDARDQSLWDRNDDYCKALEQQFDDTGLKIVHVSMADIKKLSGPELDRMFDTTGEDLAGYGGARNMAYMLAPMIRQCELDGTNWKEMNAREALPLIQATALEDNTTKLFMGDDTDQISHGTMLSKSVLAGEHAEDYTLISTMRDGRDTMGVSPAQTNDPSLLLTQGLDGFVSMAHSSNAWNATAKAAGMGCTFGDSRFCLDLPLGAEEKQHEAMQMGSDQFSRSTHLSGDRQQALSEHLNKHLAYVNSSSMVKSLVHESELPWNKAHRQTDPTSGTQRFNALKEVLDYASNPIQVETTQREFFQRMAEWRNLEPVEDSPLKLDRSPENALVALSKIPHNIPGYDQLMEAYSSAPDSIKTANGAIVDYYLNSHPELKAEDREQLEKVRDMYEKYGGEMTLAREYMSGIMDELVPAAGDLEIGSKLSVEDLKEALAESLKPPPPDKAQLAVAKVRGDMTANGVNFSENRLLRDVDLITQSLGAGRFAGMAQTLSSPAVGIEMEEVPELGLEDVVETDDLPAHRNESEGIMEEMDQSELTREDRPMTTAEALGRNDSPSEDAGKPQLMKKSQDNREGLTTGEVFRKNKDMATSPISPGEKRKGTTPS